MQSPIAMKPVSFLAHSMAKGSPLYGKTQQDLLRERGFIVVRCCRDLHPEAVQP